MMKMMEQQPRKNPRSALSCSTTTTMYIYIAFNIEMRIIFLESVIV